MARYKFEGIILSAYSSKNYIKEYIEKIKQNNRKKLIMKKKKEG